ncbi:MAG: magnesium/cobalt transporter CorA [Gammaproteobacteria bacterium]|nr:magnesium/cobalt transporter CorA [Gammaproteobacteria bacterium]
MKKIINNPLFSDLINRAKKAGEAPGTAVYTGNQTEKPVITVTTFDEAHCKTTTGPHLDECLSEKTLAVTWINVVGLSDISIIKELAKRFTIHPLTVEDILNVDQRPKVEEFEGYVFFTLKIMHWNAKDSSLSIQQISIIFGKDLILSFLETDVAIFDQIRIKLNNTSTQTQGLRQQSSDYLAYRLIDAIVDDYFVALEYLGEEIEKVEDRIITTPTPQNARIIYRLKRQMLLLRKAVWPVREAISHLLYEENTLVTKFTRVYLRDVYDHMMQAIDTVETFRDMLSSMLDMYLSGLSIRMNEIVKTLTIITTIFIPITALASIYGMNLPDIPMMRSKWGFLVVCTLMVTSIICMILYFRKKKWV